MKKIRILFVVNFLFFVLFIFELCRTYAVFESEANGAAAASLAKWSVIVNEVDIVRNNTFSIDNIVFDNSNKVISDKFAPGISGNFDIFISALDTEVAFRYDVIFDFSGLDSSPFFVNGISDVNGNDLIRTDEFTYSGVFTLDDIDDGYITDISVELIWTNIEDNNDNDYAIGSIYDNNLEIPVSIHIIQYGGEEIEEYVEETLTEE